ncbi:unnamed protein product [Larinioides sclopetarius]|uniref:DUF4806 domain-containing protein n=2 Tax=Larinioides sclopetarius TaxID=280406 RepID=A0AAV1ZEY6_9ARAC
MIFEKTTFHVSSICLFYFSGSFGAALQHLRQAEDTSNLDSDEEVPKSKSRKRSYNHLLYPGEESDEESTSLISKKISRRNDCGIPYPVPPRKENVNYQHSPSQSLVPQSPGPSQSGKILHSNKPAACSSNSVINGKLVAWMASISNQIEQLRGQVALVLENQNKLLKQHHQVPDSDEENESLGSLPVSDDEGFKALNKKISEESHFRHMLIKVLVSVGGKDVRSLVHNMLRRILQDEVAELYSLTGRTVLKNSSKKPFIGTDVSRLIFSACQKVFKDLATEVKVKEAVRDWLQQAKVRKMRRMQRQEKIVEGDDTSEFLE